MDETEERLRHGMAFYEVATWDADKTRLDKHNTAVAYRKAKEEGIVSLVEGGMPITRAEKEVWRIEGVLPLRDARDAAEIKCRSTETTEALALEKLQVAKLRYERATIVETLQQGARL